jgi:hypothetical protein
MLSNYQDVLEKAHTIAISELGLEELPSHIDGYEQDTWAKMMLKAYENELKRLKPHTRQDTFVMSYEDEQFWSESKLDQALKFLEQSIYVYLAD